MASIVYVNGQFVDTRFATISINDRGLQFGDAVYEVWAVKSGRLFDEDGHFTRLSRSLSLLKIDDIYPRNILKIIFRQLIFKNRIKEGIIYLQISRGTALRDHAYSQDLKPNIIITARSKNFSQLEKKAQLGLSITLTQDLRWGRVDIKTTNLLPNVLAKQDAIEKGFDDVWFVDNEKYITEGSAQNAWIVTQENEIITRQLSNSILPGITRQAIMDIAGLNQMKIVERSFSIDELMKAKEAFVTSATSFATPVVKVNGERIGDGKIGEIVKKLRSDYLKPYFEL